MDIMYPAADLAVFLLGVSLISSIVISVISKGEVSHKRYALLCFSMFFWLVFIGTSLWNDLTNYCYLLAVHFMLIGYLKRYEIKINKVLILLIIFQWFAFIAVQLATSGPQNFTRIISIYINMGIVMLLISIFIIKHGVLSNIGEKFAVMNAILFTLILFFYAPYIFMNTSFENYLFQLLVINTLIPMLFFSSIIVSYLNDHIMIYRESAITDSMTGLFNRRYFMEQSNKLLSFATRNEQTCPVVMCDIDHFKSINDNYGHDVGDKAIVEFSDVLKNNVRQADLVARFGGEEFVILLPSTTLKDARSLIERIRLATENIQLKIDSNTVQFTASFGISHATSSSIESAIKMADEALYKAKESGRNKVIC